MFGFSLQFQLIILYELRLLLIGPTTTLLMSRLLTGRCSFCQL